MKKLLIGFGALAVALAVAPGFLAFEAHVVNVTAKIENALAVSTDSIDFGTVFPQEHLMKPLTVQLSGSFLEEDRVTDVSYFIRQKRKCAYTWNGGLDADLDHTATGHISLNAGTEDPTDYIIDCGPAPRVENLPQGAVWGPLPSLCEYISKEGPDDNDEIVTSFHQPWTIDQGQISWNDAYGYLTKTSGDTVDQWTIDLAVPCFGGFCAQDWLDFVRRITGNNEMTLAEANQYTQPIENEHKIFGCDLWVEVDGVTCSGGGESNFSVVSDTSNTVQGGGNAVALSFIHPAWTATPLISGATWIWATDPVTPPTSADNTQTFVKQFNVSGVATNASIKVAADNTYTLKVNGVVIGSEQADWNNFQAGTYDTYTVNNLVNGSNTIEIEVTNKGVAGSDPASNPAGLRYRLDYTTTSECSAD